MVGRFAVLLVAAVLCSTVLGQDFDLGSFLSDGQRKKAEKLSGDMNDAVKGANEATGSNITPPEEATGFMRLFFTATPSPSVTPTPSLSPTPSITPTSSVTPSTTPSVTPSTTPSTSNDVTPTPSKSPSPTPFQGENRAIIGDEPVTVVGTVTSEITEGTASFGTTEEDAKEIEVDLSTPLSTVQEGDIVTIDAIEVAGPSTGTAVQTSERFPMGMDYMLQALTRQQITCGLLIIGGSGSVVIRPPPGCVLGFVNIPLLSVYSQTRSGRIKAVFRISILCVSSEPGCVPKIRVRCGIYRPLAGPTPSATPSSLP